MTLVNKKMEKRTLENNLNAVGSAFSKEGVVGLGWNEEKGIFHAIHVLK